MPNAKKTTKVGSIAEIRECPETGSKSLHATVELKYGQLISHFDPKEVLDRPNYLTVQMSEHRHIMLNPEFLQYINHSCNPNVFFDTEKREVIALGQIENGEELTFFYPSTEWSMDRGFDCLCQSEVCLKYIQGAVHLPLNVLKTYKLSQFIQQKLGIECSGTSNP
ncbi:MAG: SET domain-containing protein [Candidatus Parabeggiatoa sp. nov. 1]|nr:MAG: SET domain-containing protein [Gammaproteobacteria bacterium]